MPKNIVIYADGTGQDGGIRPEQVMTNIFKMYRATRPGPDSPVDPRQQVAFYDPGLGTDAGITGWAAINRRLARLWSSVTGRGITTNIADCYEFIINHYQPGDRIWLFGFSRGAYTARSIANVIRLCGIPTRGPDGPLPRFRSGVRDIAMRAVIRVAEHGAGHPRTRYDTERDELARRFRLQHGSDNRGEANAAPYFIGLFDTVAALGARGPLRLLLTLYLVILVAALASALATAAHIAFGLHFAASFMVAAALTAAWAAWAYLRTSLKLMWPPLPGRRWPSVHIAQWSGRYYDRLLGRMVRYARHAIAIDENRAAFPRLPWGPVKDVILVPNGVGEPERFIQLWFAGNHADIGGGYPEAESRLSDISLEWMVDEATSVPHPLLVDRARLQGYPSPDGLQHDEIAGLADTIHRLTPAPLRFLTRAVNWATGKRDPIATATLHPSVEARFQLPTAPHQGGDAPYRPEALRHHERLKSFYR